MEAFSGVFLAEGRPVFQVELAASLEERLRRNTTPLRLANKPSKRDLAASEARLLSAERARRFGSAGEFDGLPHHLRLDTTELSPAEAAAAIVERFGLCAGGR